jgi:hypothetical protein
VTEDIKPSVVHLQFGYEEANANILTDNAAFDPVTGSTELKSSLCQVAPVANTAADAVVEVAS